MSSPVQLIAHAPELGANCSQSNNQFFSEKLIKFIDGVREAFIKVSRTTPRVLENRDQNRRHIYFLYFL